jgi:hypothetical protein
MVYFLPYFGRPIISLALFSARAGDHILALHSG